MDGVEANGVDGVDVRPVAVALEREVLALQVQALHEHVNQ